MYETYGEGNEIENAKDFNVSRFLRRNVNRDAIGGVAKIIQRERGRYKYKL